MHVHRLKNNFEGLIGGIKHNEEVRWNEHK